MIRSLLFSIIATIAVTLGIGFWVNNWFLQGYNWLWIAIPTFWVAIKGFSRIFRMIDVILGICIIILIVYLSKNGCTIPFLK